MQSIARLFEPQGDGFPRQCAHWLGMTRKNEVAPINDHLLGAPLFSHDACIQQGKFADEVGKMTVHRDVWLFGFRCAIMRLLEVGQ